MTSSTDKLGRTGTDSYDDLGKVTSAVRKDGSTVNFVASTSGGTEDSYTITNLNQISSGGTVAKATTPILIDREKIKSVDGNGNVTETKFNKFGQAIEIKDAIGTNPKKNTYDSRGSLTQTIDELGNKITYGYNDKRQVTEIAYGDKLSTAPISTALYDEPSIGIPTGFNINHLVYAQDTSAASINKQHLITSDYAGHITIKDLDTNGAVVDTHYDNLRRYLPGTYDKLKIEKLLVGDFNNDGIQDFAVGYSREVFNDRLTNYLSPYTAFTGGVTSYSNNLIYTIDAGIVILTGKATGGFDYKSNNIINAAAKRNDVFQFEIADLVAADFNNDGTTDIAAANFIDPGAPNWTKDNNYQLYMLSNDGTGKFTSFAGNDVVNRAWKPFTTGDYKGSLATVKDGSDNFLVVAGANAGLNSSKIILYKVNALGELNQVYNYDIPGLVNDIKTADLNGDGVNEILLNAGRIYVINPKLPVSSTNPQASAFTTQNTGFWSRMDVADVNGDGVKDVVIANDNSTLKIYLGTNVVGMTKFDTAPQIYKGALSPRSLIVTDINGDARPDIIIGDAFTGIDIRPHSQPSTAATDATVAHKTFIYDDRFGQIKESIDELGRRTIYKIDPTNGDRLSETRVVGTFDEDFGGTDDVITRYTYNSRGQMLTMKDPRGYITNYNYGANLLGANPLGQLSSVKDATGSTSYYGYDAAGNRNHVIDNEGNQTDFAFDNMNRLTDTYGALPDPLFPLSSRPHTHNEYYTNGQIKSVTDPNSHTTYYYYDGLSRLIETKDAEGNQTFVEYDGAGNLDRTTDGRGNITEYKYDARNRLISTINVDDSTHRDTEYYDNDTIKRISDENGNKVKKFYDSRKRLTQETDAENNSTFYTLDAASQITEVKNARDKTTKYTYDDLGRKTSTIAPLNSNGYASATTWIEYDKNSNVTKTIDANLNPTEYTYDDLNRRIETKDALNKITTYGYDRVGNLKLVTDANSHATSYVYNGLNRQIATINALGQATNTIYDLVGNVIKVTDPTGHFMTYGYDANNRRTTSSDERGLIQTVEYNQVGLAKKVINAIGNSVTNTYDTRNRLTKATDNFGVETQTEYNDNSTIRKTIDGEGRYINYVYDGNNRRTEVIKHVNSTTFTESTVYDEVGNVTATTDGENHTTTYVYDDSNRRIKTIDPLTHATLTDYDKVGNIVQTTDALARITKSTYDNLNRQIAITQAFGTADVTTTTSTYDNVGNLIAEKDGRTYPSSFTHDTIYTYDALNRRIKTTDIYDDETTTAYYDTPALILTAIALAAPAVISPINIGKIVRTIDANNNATTSVYDILGRLTDTYDAIGHRTSHRTYYNDDRIKTAVDTHGQTTTYTYNDTLRQTIVLDPLGVTTTNTYDKVGNLIAESDSEGRTTQYQYDQLNRQKTIVDAVGGITRYTYDNNGKTTSILDAASNLTSYTYDDASRLTKEHTLLGDRIYDYDNVNNRISTTDRNGRTTAYTYDNLNRVKTELWVGNGKQFTYTYDQNSNLTSADDGTLHYDYTYDYTDLLIREDRSSAASLTVSFKYDYDSVGNLIQTDELIAGINTATTTYAYNSRNLNTEIIQSGSGLTAKRVKFTYDTIGQNTKVERYLGATTTPVLTTTNAYDVYGRLTGIDQKNSSGVTIADSVYGFDNLSRLISETKDGVNRLVSYDKIDQVKTVTGSNTEAYDYDLNGNRTNAGYATGLNNQLTSDGTYTYLYDPEGNRTRRTNIASGAVDLYSWDYRNRLTGIVSKTSIVGTVTQTVGYEYDIDDQRISKTINGVVEKYYLDGEQIAFVTDAAGNQTFHYLYGLNVDSVMAQDSPTGMVWSLADRLGTVDTLTDASGTIVDKRTFDSFGRLLSQTNPSLNCDFWHKLAVSANLCLTTTSTCPAFG